MPNTWYVDLKNGLDTNTGASFAQRVKTLAKAATLAAAGDTIKVMGTLATTASTATWTKGSSLVTLAAALTQSLYTDGRWTRSSGAVTTSLSTSAPLPKQGANANKSVCGSTFSVGLIAYWDMNAAINLSAYSQVSLWIYSDTAITANQLNLLLCSDDKGATPVNTLPIDVPLAANVWTCVTLNNGAALGSSIRSLGLSAVNSGYMTNKTVIVDDIIACKGASASDGLTLNSLISPDGQQWYHIQSIDGTSVYLDAQAATGPALAPGFQGTTGSYTFSLLKPTVVESGSPGAYKETFSGNGSSGLPIIISGGWDPTAMSSQTGWTAIDRADWAGAGINLTGTTGYVRVERFVMTRCAAPLGLVANSRGYDVRNSTFAGTASFSTMPTRAVNVDQVNFINCTGVDAILNIPETANFNTDGSAWSITNTNCFGATVGGIKVPEFVGSPSAKVSGCNCSGNAGYGFDIQSVVDGFTSNVARGNTLGGFRFKNLDEFAGYSLTSQGNLVSQVELSNAFVDIFGLDTNTPGGSALPQIKFVDDTAGRATVYNWTQYTGTSPAKVLVDLGNAGVGSAVILPQVLSQKENGSLGANSVYTSKGGITSSGVTGNGTSIGYQLKPNASAVAGDPLRFKVATVTCPANAGTVIGLFAKVDSGTISAQFRIEGGKYPGIGAPGADVVVPVTATAYTQYLIPASPSEDAEVDVYFEVWGTTTLAAYVSGPLSN